MKIVADRDIPFLRGVFEPWAEVVYLPGREITARDAVDADALIVRTRTRCDGDLLAGSWVRIVATATIGYDHIDTAACASQGIEVATSAGCNARGVLQWVGAALCGAARVQGWRPEEKTLGVVGVGNVGCLVAEYGAAWGFRVLCCDPPRAEKEGTASFVPLEVVAREADIVTFHVPLILSEPYPTSDMAGAAFFGVLKPGALVLNSSRGEILDEKALLEAMDAKHIAAAIDTWRSEPVVDRALLARALLATPHIAGYTLQGKANATRMAVEAVARRLGLPLADVLARFESGDLPAPQHPRGISWKELCGTITDYCDIAAETDRLRRDPEKFELLRETYAYREEYF